MGFRRTMDGRPLNIAVIGTGIAGMSAAWLLNQRHKVTIYEKNERIGGHSNTVNAELSSGQFPVDTGFIVYNEPNYPNLTALFRHLQVITKPSEMSFSASLQDGSFEYAGTNLNGLLGQRENLVNPRFWRMVYDIARFFREARSFVENGAGSCNTLGDFLRERKYSDAFAEDYLLPMGAAIWSTTAQEILDYPALSFIRFFLSHGLLNFRERPEWRTVEGGSRQYIKKLTQAFANQIQYNGIISIIRNSGGVIVKDKSGETRHYDHVVISTHADEALALLADADHNERKHLSCWQYTSNHAILHCDPKLMPKRQRVWSSWNFIGGNECDFNRPLCVTYWLNRLQRFDSSQPLFVTLNPVYNPAPGSVLRDFYYQHPYFNRAAILSQRSLWSLQGVRRTWYCGSYFGYGFHEDALQSGLAVAEQLGGLRRPWTVPGESDRIFVANYSQAVA